MSQTPIIGSALTSIFIFLIACSTAEAGKLSEFERDATTIPADENLEHSSHRHRKHKRHENEDFFSILFGDLVDSVVSGVVDAGAEVVGTVFAEGGANSNSRVNGSETGDLHKRQAGEPLLPFFRLNLNLQNITQNIYGFDGKLELGWGAWGVEYRQTSYRDSEQNEQLKLKQIQALYRMSFGDDVGVNFGVGSANLNGVNHSQGAMLSMPILYRPLRYLAFELRPTWLFGDELAIDELDVSTLISYQRMAFRIGYRQLKSTGDSLQGPYAGIDYIF